MAFNNGSDVIANSTLVKFCGWPTAINYLVFKTAFMWGGGGNTPLSGWEVTYKQTYSVDAFVFELACNAFRILILFLFSFFQIFQNKVFGQSFDGFQTFSHSQLQHPTFLRLVSFIEKN